MYKNVGLIPTPKKKLKNKNFPFSLPHSYLKPMLYFLSLHILFLLLRMN
jgi:hypothetical protein